MGAAIDPQVLAARVRNALPAKFASEKRMFGGITFMVNGNMLCCVSKRGLMACVGAAAEPEALARPFASPCFGSGRRMAGFVTVAPPGVADADGLNYWLALARTYVEATPRNASGQKRWRRKSAATEPSRAAA
ncbi:MAG: TfoX/Sxy family protein [Rhodospirillales bacterium]|nr:TfoX/Sxy family protein [Rhodospirillales bacterium]